jgi:cation transport ATPase
LFGLQATEATLILYDQQREMAGEKQIDVKLIEVGDHLLIRPGDKIPCDGIYFGVGYSYLNR